MVFKIPKLILSGRIALIFLLLILGSVPIVRHAQAHYYNLGGYWKPTAASGVLATAWLGGIGLLHKWTPGETGVAGYGDGMMNSPYSNYVDTTGDFLYVADRNNNRISKYIASTGELIGWIGSIAVKPAPAGAVGCSTAAVGTFTPGWCKGGSSGSGSGDGMMNGPYGIYVDTTNNFLYVADATNSRINKYTASTGAFVGWIGKIATVPTGGAAGCSTAAVGAFTPGWCTGGTAASGTGDGMVNSPYGIYVDTTNNFLYVADTTNSRINKYTASTGAFVGWIGKIATVPTGGAAGCSTAAVGAFTPGWCTGGTAASGTGDGMMNISLGMSMDTNGTTLYVSDNGNNRISKYTASTGAFVGWIGKIATVPTGGAAGCSTAAVGAFTPGWCTGGTAASGTGDGMVNSPYGIYVDTTNNFLYVADTTNSRINKYTASTGAFVGWIGKIATVPTGGAAGCSTAAVGAFTPGWCTGGTAASGTGDGMVNSPYGIYVDTTNNFLYVADTTNSRINKYTASTGAFVGWTGSAGLEYQPTWHTSGTAVSGLGDGFLNFPTAVYLDTVGNLLYIFDGNNSRISKYTASTGAFVGWIGKIATVPTGGAAGCSTAAVGAFTPGWCTGGTAASGTGDGMMNISLGMSMDTNGTTLYVSDNGNNRISKYTASTGAFVGWIGKIATVPTGGAAGCSTAAVGAFTPGWCTGGTAASGTGDGMVNSPYGIYVDTTNNFLYVADTTNSRINKYTASTGAFVGWIGKIATVPTGGAAGCSTAAVGAFTPGWCTGGTAASGTGDGMMYYPTGVSVDTLGDILYVSSLNDSRINKYTASTGAFVGWIGKIATVPTGGAAGCSTAAVGAFTPGWCIGGTSTSGTGDGMLTDARALVANPAGNYIYALETNQGRISKYSASTGAFVGWLGNILTSPTGGAIGCNGAPVDTAAPGWCTGGTTQSGYQLKMTNNARTLFVDSSENIYIADGGNNRIERLQPQDPTQPSSSTSTITGTGPVLADGVQTSTITITLKNPSGAGLSGLTPTFTATNTSGANVYGACSATTSSGVSTCTLKSTGAETKTLSIATPISVTGGTVVFNPGAATKLGFITQPVGEYASGNLNTMPAVAVQDVNGNTVTTDTSSITLSASTLSNCSDVAPGALTATTNPVAASGGISTFAGVQYNQTAPIYIKAASGTYTSACSSQVRFRKTITYVANAAATTGAAAASVTVSVPAGTANGQVMIAMINYKSTTAMATPAGWTFVDSATNASMYQYVFYRVASSEPASYVFTLGANSQGNGVILTYSGVDTTSPIAAEALLSGAGNPIRAPSVSAPEIDSYLVLGYGDSNGTAITLPVGPNARGTATSTGNPASSRAALSTADKALTSSGATGNYDANAATAGNSIGAQVVLKRGYY